MSQTLLRALLLAIVVVGGSSVALAQGKAIPKDDRAKMSGIWAEDCANAKGKWVDVVAGWVEVWQGGHMVTNKEGKRVFKAAGKKVYRTRYASVQAAAPGDVAAQTTSNGTVSMKMIGDGKMKLAIKDPGSKYGFEFAGDLTQCK